MLSGTEILESLPIAVYTTDAEGRLTSYNDAAAELWGCRPELQKTRWCGSWRLYWPDGRPMPHDDCPLARSLREGQPVRGVEAIAERPDGTRVTFLPFPSLVRDAEGRIVGAVNALVDVTGRRQAELDLARLAAIVSSSDDAIISKDLDGTITTWNDGAARIFGYTAAEMVGASIYRIIPPELHAQEAEILARLRRGERIDHFDTHRIGKEGRRVAVSLTVSPIRDGSGKVVGASKVARDVTERMRNEELQRLLLTELNHRVKNTLATIQAIARQSLKSQPEPGAFVASFNGRIQALARAHDLLVRGDMQRAELAHLIREQVDLGARDPRLSWSGPAVMLDSRLALQMALVLHELATNARKYGALSVSSGVLDISWSILAGEDRELRVEWRESGLDSVSVPERQGFGTLLIERSLVANGGEAAISYHAGGLACDIRLPLPVDAHLGARRDAPLDPAPSSPADRTDVAGRRVLVVEDEPLIAMDIEEKLSTAGCEVVGPVASIAAARRLLDDVPPDAALIDANLAGHRADELAAELTRRGIPFAFATGFGPEALPEGFRGAPLLAKPFSSDQLIETVRALLAVASGPRGVVRLRPPGA